MSQLESSGVSVERSFNTTTTELNGITVGGCGSGTLFDHVQVHLGLDDGIEFFGGSANARHIVVTGTGDDSLDFDLGWTGNVQFYIAQQRDVAGEERCIEGDDHPTNYGLMPFSRPTVYNFTCIGSGTPGTDPQDSIALRRGGQLTFRNGILWNSPDRGLFVQDSADSSGVMAGMDTIAWLRGSPAGTVFENNLLFQIGPDPRTRFFSLRTGSMDATGVDDITASLAAANDEGVDPMMPAAATDFAAVSSVPDGGYVVDETITDPRPGSTPYAGNAVLGAWFDYDPTTHVVSPRDTTFAVRLADGSLGKLEIRSYGAGVFVLGWSYAGPLRRDFPG